jgi:hypothetical protein
MHGERPGKRGTHAQRPVALLKSHLGGGGLSGLHELPDLPMLSRCGQETALQLGEGPAAQDEGFTATRSGASPWGEPPTDPGPDPARLAGTQGPSSFAGGKCVWLGEQTVDDLGDPDIIQRLIGAHPGLPWVHSQSPPHQ